MIPPTFDYAAPSTLPEAISLLTQNTGAKILAGGHSLIPLMRFRLAGPSMLVDINRLEGLAYIREADGWLQLGAMTREADLDRSSLVHERYPLLADTARTIADPLVRERATVGGNLAHGDPANDHPATMLAYGAQVTAAGPNGERTIACADFFTDLFTTALAADEILTEIRIPMPQPHSGGAYFKMERKVGDYGTAGVAAQVRLDDASQVVEAGIGLTNVGSVPISAAAAAAALVGHPLDDDHIKQAAALAAQAAQPVADRRGTEEYKRALVKTLTVRALRAAAARAKGGPA
jgi:aerobic carbon-monoxide dehydrogenase medium subunit